MSFNAQWHWHLIENDSVIERSMTVLFNGQWQWHLMDTTVAFNGQLQCNLMDNNIVFTGNEDSDFSVFTVSEWKTPTLETLTALTLTLQIVVAMHTV